MMFEFDFATIRSTISRWLGGYASLGINDASKSMWIFPNGAGTPVMLKVDGDACDIYAGLTFHATVYGVESGDEAFVFDCIRSIISGRAIEYYDFKNPEGSARDFGAYGFGFTGELISMTTESTKDAHQVEAWSVVPELAF